MMKRWIAAAMAAGLLACNLAFAQAKDVSELAWVEGPTTAQIAGKATLKVPEGYAFLDPAGAREFNRLTENPDSGIDEYVLAKDDLSWVAFFTFDPVGYVKDDEKLEAEDLLQSVTEGTEASNEERKRNGWDAVHVTGWAFKPQIVLLHDMTGIAPSPNQNFIAGRSQAVVGTDINFTQNLTGHFQYDWYWGGARYMNALKDRDNMSVSVAYSF